MTAPRDLIDHLVYAAPDLDVAVAELERRLGVRAAEGGRHPDEGTRNALLALGGRMYLEIVGPDRLQPAPAHPRWFGIDTLRTPRLAAWAARADDLAAIRRVADVHAISLGPIRAGQRARPNGARLTWSVTDPHTVTASGIVPFYIDWGSSPHPSESAPEGVTLVDLRAEHPSADRVAWLLEKLDIAMSVAPAASPALIAVLETPRGRVELR